MEKKIASPVEHRFDLIDPDALLAMARVMYEGAKDHAPEGWRTMSVDDILNHALVHIITHLTGRPDGEDHLANAMTRLMMAWAAKERDRRMQKDKDEEDRVLGMEKKKDLGSHLEVLYISYPYADDPEMRTRIVTKIARRVFLHYYSRGLNVLLIVPHLSFAPLFAESTERELGLTMCELAVRLCTRFIIAGDHISNGMEREINVAKERGIPIDHWSDMGEKDEALNEDWPPGGDPALRPAPVTDGKPRVPRYPRHQVQESSLIPESCTSCGRHYHLSGPGKAVGTIMCSDLKPAVGTITEFNTRVTPPPTCPIRGLCTDESEGA